MKVKADNFNIPQIADSGQIFRFTGDDDGKYLLRAADRELHITCNDDGSYEFDCEQKEFNEFWKHYFDLETDYSRFIESIPAEDEFLTKAAGYSEGIRILNQDPWEMLISFIISQRKSIPAIRTSIEKLCKACGSTAFPEPARVADLTMGELEACSLGYRAEYIYLVSRQVAAGEIDMRAMASLNDDELRKELLKIKGVGIKVANCVMLFGYHRIGAFPIDVWIQKMIDTHYSGSFPVELYDGFAGVIQQYIFFYGRESSKIGQK